MTAAFQLNAFQPDAFQSAVVTGVLYAVDQDDTASIVGLVGSGENVDTHDGFTHKEVKHLEKIRKKLAKLRLQEEQAFAQSNEKRKKTIQNIVDPQKVVEVKQDEVELSQAIEKPTFDIQKLMADIARMELQQQLLEKQIAQKQALQAYQQYIAHLEAQMKAELDDEEALLMLL
jgi:hypothetical protein